MNLQKNNPDCEKNTSAKVTRILFIIYLVALFWILLFKLGVRFSYMGNRRINLIPFREAFVLHGRIDTAEIILNVLIFVPLGVYAETLFERWHFGKKIVFFFLASLLFEALQFIFKAGAFDITDILTNTFGGLVGLLIFRVIEKVFNNRSKAKKVINIVAAIGTVLMISLLLLLKMNLLPVRYQ